MIDGMPSWLTELNEEELNFIKRFLLLSGSLKSLAAEYGVSYPTVRVRLDRLIEKVRVLDEPAPKSHIHRRLKLLVAEGRIDTATARAILRAHEKTLAEETGK